MTPKTPLEYAPAIYQVYILGVGSGVYEETQPRCWLFGYPSFCLYLNRFLNGNPDLVNMNF